MTERTVVTTAAVAPRLVTTTVDGRTVLVPTLDPTRVLSVGVPGPRGDTGAAFGTEFFQVSPSAEWVVDIPFDLDRRPSVTLYDVNGKEVEADVFVSASTVTVTFPAPFAGSLVLT